jgi:seryl-tRNA synthetase
MSDIDVENYKKSVTRVVDDWGKEAARIARELGPIDETLEKLEAIDQPSPDDKKQIETLAKKRDALRAQMEDASVSLNVNLVVLDVPEKADEKELVKIPAWLKELIKHKGIPLGHGVSIAPTVDFDIKKRKLKSVGVIVRW